MKTILLIIITAITLNFQMLFSQNYFQRALGDSMSQLLNSIELLSDAEFIGAGYTSKLNPYSKHGWICKFDIDGNILWDKTYQRYGSEEFKRIIKTDNGEFLAIGKTDSLSTSKAALLIVKFDVNGDTIWVKTIATNEFIDIKHIEALSTGGFIMTGATRQSNINKIVLIKINTHGVVDWVNHYGHLNYSQTGYCVKQTQGGFVIVGNNTYGSASNQHSGFLLVTDSLGNKLWDKYFHPKTNVDDDTGQGSYVIQSKDKGYVFGGEFYINNTSQTILVKLDSNGNEIWHNYFNNIGGGPVSIIEEIDSSLTLITSKGNLIKLNFNGNVIWSKVIDKGLAKDLKKLENGYIYVGETNQFGNGLYDGLIVATDIYGNTYCSDSVAIPIFDSTGYDNNGAITDFGTSTIYYLNDTVLVKDNYSTMETNCDTIIYNSSQNLISQSSIKYYPNPAQGHLNILPSFDKRYHIRLINSIGIEIESKIASGNYRLELGNISKGIYIVEIIADKKRHLYKLLKQ